AFTGLARTRPRVLLVAGGVGIVPLRALLEEIPVQPGDTDLVYRARSWEDVVFRDELDALAAERQFTIHWLIGQRNMAPLRNDPLAPALFTRIVPDVRDRDVFVCGPPGMIAAVRRSMRALGVPNRQIHEERFAY
ncbi:MAG: hypothetical protein QOG64_255, partial [Acidimicrobiaceae bacterium]|nr:hypothetical protein [Acidimicrobiaceae bacterium]